MISFEDLIRFYTIASFASVALLIVVYLMVRRIKK